MEENDFYTSDESMENEDPNEHEDGGTPVDLLEEIQEAEQKVEKMITNNLNFVDIFENYICPEYKDISALFSDGVPFLIEGDSLLIMLMDDDQWCRQLSGSSLHLIYLIESYINIFVERGGIFHMVFFDSWKSVWENNYTILLYRQIVIEHFSRNTNYGVHIFNNCFDTKFMDLIYKLCPQFILSNLNMKNHCSKYDISIQNRAKVMIIPQILYCLSEDLPCVDCNNIQVEDFNVYAFYTTSSKAIGRLFDRLRLKFKSYLICPIPKATVIQVSGMEKINISDGRTLISILAAKQYFKNNSKNKTNILPILLLNSSIMDTLNIENRSCCKFGKEEDILKLENYISIWHKCLYDAMCSIKNMNVKNVNFNSISDLWQGLLFGHLCRFLEEQIENSAQLGSLVSMKYEQIITALQTVGVSLNAYPISSAFLKIKWRGNYKPQITYLEKTNSLNIENPLVVEFCKSIMSDMKWIEPPPELIKRRKYTEEHHYHSMRMISDEHDRIKNTIQPMPTTYYAKKDKKNRQARYMTIYGSSLEGHILKSNAVIRTNTKDNVTETKIKKVSKKAQAIIDQNKIRKLLDQENTDKALLLDVTTAYKKSKIDVKSHLCTINLFINKITTPAVCSDIHLLKIKILLNIFEKETCNDNIKKDLFLCLRKILSFPKINKTLTSKQKKLLSNALQAIDCSEIAKRNELPIPLEDSNVDNDNWIRYQLKCLGPELERTSDGAPDHRVKNFIPDNWQRELFNIVDKRQSAVIVAPTSSGKTYASYYCMESVLKEGTEGVVVYVSPTKALVNQVAATVYARFKNTVMPAGQSVYGIFTRDFRTYATDCQILITVPQCLELLLMSPRKYEWVKRLRYVIFDEIHCIAGNIGGIFWERCLMLIRCPFLALSATIRHPQKLQIWLQEAENFKQKRDVLINEQRPEDSYKVNLIIHSERHSDLTKYVYNNAQFHHLHPYANLNNSVMKSHGGIPKHLLLSPAEILELFEAMYNANPQSVNLYELELKSYFSKRAVNGFITRNLVNDYENLLSRLLIDWYKYDKNAFCNTISFFKLGNDCQILEQNDIFYMMKNIHNLVMTLKNQNMLPAIIFSYNRNLVEYMTYKVTDYLKRSDIEPDRRSEKKILKEEKKQKKEKEKLDTVVKKNSKDDLFTGNDFKVNRYKMKANKPELNILQSNVNSLRVVGNVDTGDLQFIEERLYRGLLNNKINWLVDALRHGVAMHHSGLSAPIRSAVEMLFRMKVINIVFATGTLALGIHMPCKTTVVAGDSPYLNSLEYHQMSGRAGRRGFDTEGNVIFYSLNSRKQHTLLTAHLPSIKGIFPLSITFVLRLMLLVSDVTYRGKPSESATKNTISRVLTLLENSLIYKQDPKMKDQMKHFFSFSLQFLIMQEFVDGNGVPLKWCGLATHLHYHQPGNLALVYLLQSGVLHQLCSQKSKKGKDNKKIISDEDVQYQLVIILSYLFTNMPIHSYTENTVFYNSKVILDPLPDLIKDVLVKYNAEVDFVFNQYFANVATNCPIQDTTLPLSNIDLSSKLKKETLEDEDCLQEKFLKFCKPTVLCSTFAALSGNNDNYNLYSKSKLTQNIKTGVCNDVTIVPTINYDAKLNGYALDFYRHGIITAIRNDNGLKAGEEFTKLKDFLLIIKTIRVSLEETQINKNDRVYYHFHLLEENYMKVFQQAFPGYNY